MERTAACHGQCANPASSSWYLTPGWYLGKSRLYAKGWMLSFTISRLLGTFPLLIMYVPLTAPRLGMAKQLCYILRQCARLTG